MSYTAIDAAEIGVMFDVADYTQLKDNFDASLPGLYTNSGDLAAGTGSQALGVTTVASERALVADSTQANGLNWAGGTVPIGIIIIWSGAVGSIPSGWQICDGTNGTPDLRGRFVGGASAGVAPGTTGGAATANLQHAHTGLSAATGSDNFTHDHTQGNTGNENSHTHTASGATGGPHATVNAATGGAALTASDPTHTHAVVSPTSEAWPLIGHHHSNPNFGSTTTAHTHAPAVANDLSAAQSILPAYYALCFIQRLS